MSIKEGGGGEEASEPGGEWWVEEVAEVEGTEGGALPGPFSWFRIPLARRSTSSLLYFGLNSITSTK